MFNPSSRPTQIIIGTVIIIALSACQPNAATIEPIVANTPTVQPSNTLIPIATATTTLEPTITSTPTPEVSATTNPNILKNVTPKEGFIWKNLGDVKFTPMEGIQEYAVGNKVTHRFVIEAAPLEIFVGTDGNRYFRGIVEKGGSPVLIKITGEISRDDSSGLNFVSNEDISKLVIPSNQMVGIQFYVGNDEKLNQATITEMMRTNTFGNKSLEGKRVALGGGVSIKR